MSNPKNNPKTKNQTAGFYIALGVCLLALAGAIYLSVNSMVTEVEEQTLEVPDSVASYEVSSSQADVDVEETATEQVEEAEEVEETQTTETEQTVVMEFASPIEGTVINGYSDGELVKSLTLDEWRTHDGVDIAAAANTPVKSIADGFVEEITNDPLWGVCITVTHDNGYVSYYKGLKEDVEVEVGEKVALGSILGYVGNTAEIEIAEESHLHFEVKLNDNWIDPLALIEK